MNWASETSGFTGNQQLGGAGAARLWFIRGNDMV